MKFDGTKPAVEEFWSWVDRRGDNDCWPWRGSLHFNGYGGWQCGRTRFVAHRFAYELFKGAMPARTHLFHTCALRSCVNPRHLREVRRPDARATVGRPLTGMELAWSAGIWEGEGSCWPNARTQFRRGRSMTLHTSVSQHDPERWVLERLRDLFGGAIDRDDADDPDSYRWRVTGARGRGFLMTIYAFLSPRRRAQVRAALTRSKPRPRGSDFCRRGHLLTEENVIRGAHGRRQCRRCVDTNRRLRQAARRARPGQRRALA